ncbi:Uncharacterised protein [uncultured archaeon]|nr:Uncharacterised protein [uncultured archaeon]
MAGSSAVAASLLLLFLLSAAGCGQQPQGQGGTVQGIGDAQGRGVNQVGLQGSYSSEEQARLDSAVASLMQKYGMQERPEAAIIKDAAALKQKQRAIYANAENGFVLAVWPGLLVIYDPAKAVVVQELEINSVQG